MTELNNYSPHLFKKGQNLSFYLSHDSPSSIKISKYHILIQIQGSENSGGIEFAQIFQWPIAKDLTLGMKHGTTRFYFGCG